MTDRFSQVKTDVLQTLFNQDIELKNNIVPDADNSYDLGTPARRIRAIYANTTVGTISNPNIDTDNLRFPFTGPQDIRLTRTGTSQLNIDNNAGGAAQVVINGSLNATSINATSIAATALRNVSITPGTPNTGDVLKATSGTTAEWQAGGDVTGPATAGNNNLVRFDGSTGKLIKDSNVTVDDAGNVTTAGGITANSITSPDNRATALRNVVLPLTAPVSSQILRATSDTTAEWANVAGTGDVVGPASSTDNAIALFDSTSGKLLKENSFWRIGVTANALQCIDPIDSTIYFSLSPNAGSIGTVGPNSLQTFLSTRRVTDTNQRITINNAGDIIVGPGNAAQDVRLSRTAASTFTIDNNSTGAATLASNAGTLSNFATITRAGALAITTSASNGNITYTTNGSGSHIFNSTTGNMQINRPITTASGDLTLNPAGTNIAHSNKNLTGCLTVQTPSITTATGDVSINPAGSNINMNSKTLTNVAVITSASLEPQIRPATGWGRTRFSNGATTGNVVIETGTTLPGYQALTFNGFSDGTEQRYNTGKRRWREMVFQNATSDNYTIDSFDGTTTRQHIFVDPSVSEQVSFPQGLRTATIATGTGDISINPAGTNININSKTLNSVGNMITDNSTTAIGFPKIRVFNSGADIYGFGLQSNVLSYETVPTGSNHVFYVANTERMRINATALQLAVPITTGSGDLSLNPAGSNINCNNKTLTNVTINSSSVNIRSLCNSKAVGTNFGSFSTVSFDFLPVGDILQGSLSIPANYFNALGKGVRIEATLNVNVASGNFTFSSFLGGTLVQSGLITAVSSVWLVRLQLQTEVVGTSATIGYNFSMTPVTGTTTQINAVSSGISHTTANALVVRFSGIFSASASQNASMGGLTITQT